MSTMIFIQMECDGCGCCDYHVPPKPKALAWFKEQGWLFKKGRHFCDEKCVSRYEANKSPEKN